MPAMRRNLLAATALAVLIGAYVVTAHDPSGSGTRPAASSGDAAANHAPPSWLRSATTAPGRDTDAGWDEYTKLKGSGDKASEALHMILARGGLTPTRRNADAVIAALSGTVTSEEKAGLAKLLARMHLDMQDSDTRVMIEKSLTSAALSSNDPVIATAATLAYSRLGWFPNTLQVLDHAYKAGYIAGNDYFGDMAHVLPAAPPNTSLSCCAVLLRAGTN